MSRLGGGLKKKYAGGVNVYNLSESLKEKQARYREAREKRSAQLGPAHEVLIQNIAGHVGLRTVEVTEFILDSEDQIQLMNSFVTAGGNLSLTVFYQKGDAPRLESGRTIVRQEILKKVFATSGGNEAATCKIIFYIKTQNDRNLTAKSMVDEMSYAMLDLEQHEGLLPALKSLMSQINLPQLSACSDWGPMVKTLQGQKNKDEFLQGLEAFINYLENADSNVRGAVYLQDVIEVDVSHITSAQECKEAAKNIDLVEKLEQLVMGWRDQIEQVLGESEQMRKEADDTGPLAELEYWRFLMSKFNSLFDCLKKPRCRAVINTLNAAKSKVVRTWRDMDAKITDNANEAKDNVRYLYALENECGKLYHSQPLGMIEIIPSLINIISMIRDVSKYYNTPQRLTSLFVKVTNQMVSGCRKYLTNNNKTKIWDQEPDVVKKNITECICVSTEYKKAFHNMNQPKNSTDEKSELSEMYIFGKLETFCKRLYQIQDYLDTVERFSVLANSGIEGMEPLGNRLLGLITLMKKKPYDILDFRKPDFEDDYAVFRDGICELEAMINNFLDVAFKRTRGSLQGLLILKKFENFNIYCLKDVIADKYFQALNRYTAEIEDVKKRYKRLHDEPPIARNMPPVSGKVLWARQLFRKIREPMESIIKFSPEILKEREGKKICHSYNTVGKTLMEFEVLYYRAWCREAENIKNCLQATLLVKDEDQNIFLNFDPQIAEMTRESMCIQKMGLELPATTIDLLRRSNVLKLCQSRLTRILQTYNDVKSSIPLVFQPSLKGQLKEVQRAVSHGLIFATWTSLNHEAYFGEVERKIALLKKKVEILVDLRQTRIIDICQEIIDTEYMELDETYPLLLFLKRMKEKVAWMTNFLNGKCEYVENATKDLVSLLRRFSSKGSSAEDDDEEEPVKSKAETSKEEENFLQECAEMIDFFKMKTYDAIVKGIKLAVESLKKRTQLYNKSQFNRGDSDNVSKNPLLEISIELNKPNVELKPTIEEVQHTINECARMMVDVGKGIPLWAVDGGADDPADAPTDQSDLTKRRNPRNLHKTVTDNKDVTKTVMMLSSTMNSLRQPVQKALVRFSEFKYLWELDLQTEMTAFKATKPLIVDYKAEILKFANVAGKIDLVDKNIIVGPLSLNCANVKASLKKEAAVWKKSLCSLLNAEYRPHMFEVSSLVEDYLKKLSRPIRDLDDIRESMASLDKLKHEYIRVDFLLGPIEETYSILQKFGLEVNAEEQNKADSLRFDWDRLQVQATQVSNHLLDVQPKFRSDLIDKISEFQLDLENFKDAYLTEGPMEVGISAQEASDRVQVFSSEFADLNRKFTQNASGEELFGLEVRSYPFLNKVKREMTLLQKLYGLYNQVMKSVNGYYELLWSEVDIEAINTELTDFSTRCRKLPKGLKSWPAFNVLKKKIDDFSETCPLLEVMANPAMKKRHWNRMDVQCNYKFDVENENYTLKSIVTAPLLKYKEEIEDICTSAVKEKDIESKLNQVVNEWSAHKFYFAQFKTRGELLLKGQETMELIGFLEDSLMILSSLMGNRYNAPFKPTIALWVQKLSNTNDIIENWLIVQNLWVYLEAVFVGGDIAKELPQEAKRFQNIDKTWMKLMSRAKDIKMVVPCCVSDETMGQTLPHLLEQLESCQKSLTGYLEAKRLIFPRFFFVSDPALLEILGQASDSHSIQAHLTGIFENVYLVGFHETEYDKMISVISREKEEIMLKKPVMGKGHVESWLGELLREQQHSLHCVIGDGYTQLVEPDFDLFAYLDSAPAQVGLLALQMLWTKESETALENCKTDKKIMNNTNNRFLKVLNDLIATTTRDLGKFERIKYETCITIHVHQRDIFNDLVRLHIKVLNDFEWLKQSRFYFNVDLDVCVVSITNVNFSYCNEFLGCTDRLVITPLTDRCYITLAQALFMHMGSAPAGPAGTGKTETTKDMGKALGKYVVVFNCSDQMDFRGLGRIYKGLAQSGSWGCFDEFNRIDLPVLSVAAQQIYIVLQAKKDHKTTFIFTDGDSVSLDPEFGLFITMNPGYAGRQELPENLKVQFRTVSMMVPDRQIIMRVKLASCGFIENIVLAQKFYTLYKLCEEQLTKQVHYDFGLRNILSVLRTLGAAKRKRPDDSETTIVMRGLRDMNLSKLVDEDEPLFLSLISDLFPGIVLETADYVDLQAAIQANVKSMKCVNHPNWNLKVVQLFETQNVRHGMMTLGPSGAGKTLCINMIMRAMSACGTPHREVRMNPKSITAPQMFGRLDVATNDWTDGIFSTLWRRSHKTKKGEKLWIILDGPVDAIWIENLNSVLDDNKTLTLANGDRIVMAPTCKILFEVHNIDNASPATVSRVGMVFMSSSVLDWKPILEGWIMTRPASEQEMLRSLFHSMFEDAYNFVMQSCIPKMALYQCNYIVQAGNVLEGSIPPKEACGKNFTKHVEHLFVFSLMWSVGALLELEDRYRLQQFIRNHKSKLDLPKMEEGSGRTIFEYVPNVNGTWDHWSARLVEYEYPKDHVPEYTGILVPNVDNVRTRHLIDIISKQGKGVLLIGEQGTGKTVVVKGYMNDFNSEEMLSKSLNFSSATEPGMFQVLMCSVHSLNV